jgi:hypothetical protein
MVHVVGAHTEAPCNNGGRGTVPTRSVGVKVDGAELNVDDVTGLEDAIAVSIGEGDVGNRSKLASTALHGTQSIHSAGAHESFPCRIDRINGYTIRRDRGMEFLRTQVAVRGLDHGCYGCGDG